jgi:hypothetical protein
LNIFETAVYLVYKEYLTHLGVYSMKEVPTASENSLMVILKDTEK